jgi:hypothetical protein
MYELRDHHLDSDVEKNRADALFEVDEFTDHVSDDEVERTESENREHIRGDDDERISRDGDDCRDRIDREYEIRNLDEYECDEKRRDIEESIFFRYEFISGMITHESKVFFHPDNNWMSSDISSIFFLSPDHLIGGPEQDGTENIYDEFELIQKFDACEDENNSHDDRCEDPPFEYLRTMLFASLHASKNHQENKEIIDGEGFLDEISREKFDSELMIYGWVVEKKYRRIENKSHRDPYNAPHNIGFHTTLSAV